MLNNRFKRRPRSKINGRGFLAGRAQLTDKDESIVLFVSVCSSNSEHLFLR